MGQTCMKDRPDTSGCWLMGEREDKRMGALVEVIPHFAYRPVSEDGTGGLRGCPETTSSTPYFTADIPELERMSITGHPAPLSGKIHKFQLSGSTYQGQWKGYARHGYGIQCWPDGAEYAGQWVDSLVSGLGRFKTKNGDKYVGQWEEGQAHGLGVYRAEGNLSSYEGEWRADRPCGSGVESWLDGSGYKGQFGAEGKQGCGVFTGSDGSAYFGEWMDNQFQGHGRYCHSDGREVSGEWRSHALMGQGRYQWAEGHVYSGQFNDDQRHGFGVLLWKNGARFEGWWHEGAQVGRGRLISHALNLQENKHEQDHMSKDERFEKTFTSETFLERDAPAD